MAGVKYIKIPTDFFEREPIATIRDLPEGGEAILLYLKILFEAYEQNNEGVFKIPDWCRHEWKALMLGVLFNLNDAVSLLDILEEYELVKRTDTSIQVFKFWEDKHNRNSTRYKKWRSAVYERDGYKCTKCGNKNHLQAHHIKPWKWCEAGRYLVDNGITLCRKCHLEAHGGCWHDGRC